MVTNNERSKQINSNRTYEARSVARQPMQRSKMLGLGVRMRQIK